MFAFKKCQCGQCIEYVTISCTCGFKCCGEAHFGEHALDNDGGTHQPTRICIPLSDQDVYVLQKAELTYVANYTSQLVQERNQKSMNC